jgi:hypothetical protein
VRAGSASDLVYYVNLPVSPATARSSCPVTRGILRPNDVAGYGICTFTSGWFPPTRGQAKEQLPRGRLHVAADPSRCHGPNW